MSDETHPLDSSEIELLISLMGRLPSPIPPDLFAVFAARFPQVAVEMVIIRKIGGVIHVLLTQRPTDDPHWPGMWHSPGSLVRSSDAPPVPGLGTFNSVIRRIQAEIGVKFLGYPTLVTVQFQQVARGCEIALVHFADVIGNPTYGTFYSVDALPENFIEHQRAVIQAAVAAWKRCN